MTYLDAEGDGPMNHDYDEDRDLTEGATGLGTNPFDRARQQAVPPGVQDDPHDDGLDHSFSTGASLQAESPLQAERSFNTGRSFEADDSFLDDSYDDYDEPERDTVQSGGSTEMYYEEEEGIDDLFGDDPALDATKEDEGPALTLVEGETKDTSIAGVSALEEEPIDPDTPDVGTDEWPTAGAAASLAATSWQDEPDDTSDDDWLDDDELLEDEGGDGPNWPLGLIAVAVVALVLLVAGGYGVIQQRQATAEEIRQLRAELATAANPTDVSASRQALQEMKAENDALARQVETLTRDNRRLADTVAGLEAQLDAQQAALAKAAPEPPAPKAATQATKPTSSAPKPAAPAASGAAPTGAWFVNFGSYGREAIARDWAGKLNPGSGEAVLVPAEVNGRAIYRVRVVGLNDRDSAERVARELEAEYSLPKLWVGKQ